MYKTVSQLCNLDLKINESRVFITIISFQRASLVSIYDKDLAGRKRFSALTNKIYVQQMF